MSISQAAGYPAVPASASKTMSFLRVAIVSGFPPDPYGEAHYAGQVFSAMARYFPEHEYRVFSFARQGEQQPESFPNNLQLCRRLSAPDTFGRHFTWLIALIEILRFRPSVVHLQGAHTKMWGGLFGEHMCLLYVALRLLGIPVVHSLHATMVPADLEETLNRRQLPSWGKKAFLAIYRAHLHLLTKLSSHINVVCAGDGRQLRDRFAAAWGLNSQSLDLEPHACEFRPSAPSQHADAKAAIGLGNQRLAIMAGFLRPDKNAHLFLETADRVLDAIPDLHYVIAGEPRGPAAECYAQSLRQIIASLRHSERVHLRTGYLSDDVLEQYFRAADVIVIPYDRAPGPSGPIHHALGHAKPVIAAAVGHNLGLAKTISLFPRGDADALANSLIQLFSDPQTGLLKSAQAGQYAETNTWRALAARYLRKYEELNCKRYSRRTAF
jgi:glycosyltransferase involved in cell wall biosynthesis